MKRREFITLLGGAAATWPLTARGQQAAKIPRIGIIDDAPMWDAFRQGLRDLGYLDGQTIAIESSNCRGQARSACRGGSRTGPRSRWLSS